MKSLFKTTLLIAAGSALAASSAMGAFIFNDGDLILGFQATSGTGSTKNVFFNLGSGTTFRDNSAVGLLGNIGGTLSSVYGIDWYERDDLWFGVVGNLSAKPTSGIGSAGAVNGDPSRTFYLSIPTGQLGDGLLYAASSYPSAALGSAGTKLSGMESILLGLDSQSDFAAILSQATSPVEWNNSWTAWNPTPGAAFDTFTGGIQQNLGKAGTETYVDLQRVLSTNTGADPSGVVGGGVYETTFAIGSNGSITAVPEPSVSLLGLTAGALMIFRRRRNS